VASSGFGVHFLKRCSVRFVSSESELAVLATGAKEWACPHCGRHGTLNRHGRLETKSGTLRGLRFWCSPRRKSNPGCGLTFSILLAAFVPGMSVSSAALAAFLLAWFRLGGDVPAAWQSAKTGFSTDSAHRWARRFVHNQGEVRSRLCRVRAPPPTRGAGILADLFEHLSLVLESENFIEAFQIRFQRPWPMGV
jgi:hypothetical protein